MRSRVPSKPASDRDCNDTDPPGDWPRKWHMVHRPSIPLAGPTDVTLQSRRTAGYRRADIPLACAAEESVLMWRTQRACARAQRRLRCIGRRHRSRCPACVTQNSVPVSCSLLDCPCGLAHPRPRPCADRAALRLRTSPEGTVDHRQIVPKWCLGSPISVGQVP